ncbi:MAG: ANTAR domain-containing protein [Ruminococcus sp.]|nr:ANTAR domain-containing protein [Ruminococcus sp.]
MNFTERHYKILVVSADDRFIKEVASLLQGDRFRPDASHSASDARCKLLEKAYDLVVVNAPLRDDSGSRLCIDVCRDNGTIAAIFAAADIYDEIYAKVSQYGVFVLQKPSSRALVNQGISLMVCARERLRTLEKKVGKTESKLDEIRIVNKAKWLLIDHEGLSEEEAHKQIEKSAMDAGLTKKLAAQLIIDNYLK